MKVRFSGFLLLFVLLCFDLGTARSAETKWIRAGANTNALIWGIEGGLKFALHPAGFSGGAGGPRGLIRLGYPTLPNGGYDLINFIAVEPIVRNQKGFSELEKSSADGKQGKLFWVGGPELPGAETPALDPGTIETLHGVEQLTVTVFVEKFDNGAHVRLKLSQRSDAPGELKITVEAEPGSAPIESCILTATMGNKSRARLLVLKDGPVSSLQLYPDYRDVHFAPHNIYSLEQLSRNETGDVVVWIQNDEENPSTIQPFGRPHFWDYRGKKVVQYWRKEAAEVSKDLTCAVNGRFTYWGGRQPIPGGISFENFELREPFRSGQGFIFGMAFPGFVQKSVNP